MNARRPASPLAECGRERRSFGIIGAASRAAFAVVDPSHADDTRALVLYGECGSARRGTLARLSSDPRQSRPCRIPHRIAWMPCKSIGSVPTRRLFCVLGLSLALPVRAQTRPTFARIGYMALPTSTPNVRLATFKQSLRELGYLEGAHVAIEYRSADGRYDRFFAEGGGAGTAERRRRSRNRCCCVPTR